MSDQESRIEQLIAAKKKADAEVAKRISATKDEHILRTQAWSKVRRDVVEPVLTQYVQWLKERGVESHVGVRDPSDAARSGVCLFLCSSMDDNARRKPHFSVSPDYNLETVGFFASFSDPLNASLTAERRKVGEVTKEHVTDALLKFLEQHFKKV